MMIARLVSLGNVVIDIVMHIEALPERGSDVIADSASITPGGAFTVMVAACRQGLATVYGGAHGTGPFGELARVALAREAIGVALSPVAALDTGFDVAMVDATGERTFVTSVGAEGQLALGALVPGGLARADLGPAGCAAGGFALAVSVPADFRLAATDAVHVSGYGLLHPVNRDALVELLPVMPGTVFYDPGPLGHSLAESILAIVLARTDWWSGNAREATLATGIDDPVLAAAAIASHTRTGAIVRLGASGCALATRGTAPVLIPGFTVDAVDLNGAGDAHVGAFIAGLASGLSSADAARRANAVAAIAVTRHGPADAPTAAETDEFLQRVG